MSSFLKQLTSTITNEHTDYEGYYQVNVLNNTEPLNSLDKIILDRTNKYKDLTAKFNNKNKNIKMEGECIIFNDIIETMNDNRDITGVFKIKTNTYKLHENTFFIETKCILAFSEFHNCIKQISLQRRKKTKSYYYMISIIKPPINTQFDLFHYKIKHNKNEKQYIEINYSIERITKTIFDSNSDNTYSSAAVLTKLKTKLIDHKNKNKNIIYDNELIWIEQYEINIKSLFKTMVNNVNILIPIRSLKNKNIKLLTINSNLLKWGNITQIKMGKFTYIKWNLKFIKGNANHSVIIQLQMIANNKKVYEKILQNKYQLFTNSVQQNAVNNSDSNINKKQFIFDSKIKTQWTKKYYTISNMKIDKYYALSETINTAGWIRMITNKINDNVHDDDDDSKYDNIEDDEIIDMTFLKHNLKTMTSSIIPLDRRDTFLNIKTLGDIKWRKKEENNMKFIKNEIYIDIEENDIGGIVNIKNNIGGLHYFKFCIKMKDELLLITKYHKCIFLVEYKLKKTMINNESIYAYVYFFYLFAMPYGEFQLFKYKRSQNKKQCPNLITLKCNKYVVENEDDNKQKEIKNDGNIWTENYRLTLSSHFPLDSTADDVTLTIPVYINHEQKGNIKIINMSSSLLQKGKIKYILKDNCLLWNLNGFNGNNAIQRNITFKLSKVTNEIELKYKTEHDKHNVLVFGECEINSIEIPDFTLSGIIVSGIKCINHEKIKYDSWIRYNTVYNDNV